MGGAKTHRVPAGDGAWTRRVEALAGALAGHKGEASVVLADQFVRYSLLAHNATLKTPSSGWRSRTIASARCTARAAAEWEINVTETAPHGRRVSPAHWIAR